MTEETQKIQQKFQVIVMTATVVCDMMDKSYLRINKLRLVVVDGLDKIIEKGCRDNVKRILTSTDEDTQIAFFTNSVSPDMINIAEDFMKSPARILLKDYGLILDGLTQYYVDYGEEKWKFDTLVEIFKSIDLQQHYIIYCNTQQAAEELTVKLNEKSFKAASIVSYFRNFFHPIVRVINLTKTKKSQS